MLRKLTKSFELKPPCGEMTSAWLNGRDLRTMRKHIAKYALPALASAWVLLTLFTAATVSSRYPDNHGFGRSQIAAAYFLLLLTSVLLIPFSLRGSVIMAALSVASLVTITCMGHYNIMITYDEYIERRMPAWGTTTNSDDQLPVGSFWSGKTKRDDVGLE